jgi:protocatechuate 3,4-dioxygenase beta subunit
MTNNGKASGKKIKVYGKVLDNKCKPITNAVLDIWQANSFGKYNHQADLSESRKDNDFYGYIRLESNKEGEYSFNTILPGGYKVSKDLIRTPHIHFKVTNNQKQLTTQMYFKGNEMNNKDFLFKNTYNNNALEASIDESFKNLTYKFDIII